MNDATFTAHERRILYECEQGACPHCGGPRGYSVPDDCGHPACPEPWDIKHILVAQESEERHAWRRDRRR